MDYDSMRVSELKEELSKYNAPVSGNKNELIERLNQFNLKDETIITLEDDDFIETNSTERNSFI
ncbi:MAG: SAP domain-containing protein, partial [Euryarchaeota archaeon]|nr:SAP domain-containing protein [Euryarchaeota archaeon]